MNSQQSGDIKKLVFEVQGNDEDLFKGRDGQTIEALQLFLKRVAQHRFPEDNIDIEIDCGGFLEESNQALIELAEKLKGVALQRGRSVYFRALPPKDRKVIHQYLATDERIRSKSIGEGLYKKIKIFPAKQASQSSESTVN